MLFKKRTRTLNFWGRLSVLMAVFIVTLGMVSQMPMLHSMAESKIDPKFASAVAEQMSQSLRLRLEDTRRLQLVAGKHPSTLNALQHGDAQWVKDLSGFMPGSQEVQLVTPAIARELHKSFGFAVQELVMNTLKGTETRLEALKKLDGIVRLYWATPIVDKKKEIVGVLLVEYGQSWLSQFQAAANEELGELTVVQYTDAKQSHSIEIFKVGSAKRRGDRVTVQIMNDWYLSFVPNNDELGFVDVAPLYTSWFVAIGLVFLVLAGLLVYQELKIRANQKDLLLFLRARRNDPGVPIPEFDFKLFFDLAEHLGRYQRMQDKAEQDAARVAAAKPSKATRPPQPLPEPTLEVNSELKLPD